MSHDFMPIDSPGAADFTLPRVESLRRQAANLEAGGLPDDKKLAEMRKAAEGFESIFVHMLMKSMKTAMLDEDSASEGALSFGGAALDGYVDLQFSEYAAGQGGFGLADQIFAQMSGGGRMPLRTQMQLPNTSLSPESTAPGNSAQTQNAVASSSVENPQPKQNDMITNLMTSAENVLAQAKASKPSAASGNTFLDRVIERIRPFEAEIQRASTEHRVPTSLVKAVIAAESAGQANAVSPAGAKGLMQLMDGTAGDLGVNNSFDPAANISGGTRYLSEMLRRFDGDQTKALAAYNAGPGTVNKYNGMPPYPETQAYVNNVQRYNELFAILENTTLPNPGNTSQSYRNTEIASSGFPL